MKTRNLVLFALLAGLVYLTFLSYQGGGSRVGEEAPDFSLPAAKPGFDGENPVGLSDLRGQWVLVNFWATWCPPCVHEMPSLESLKSKMEGRGLRVLAVSVDEDGWNAIDRFRSRLPLTMTILWDARGEVAAKYGVFQLPQTYLIDRDGRIVKEYQGPRDWSSPGIVAEIERYVQAP